MEGKKWVVQDGLIGVRLRESETKTKREGGINCIS